MLVLCLFSSVVWAQQWQTALEHYAENNDNIDNISEVLEEWAALENEPANINMPKHLLALHLIDELQYNALQIYIKENGALLSLNELVFVGGFDQEQIMLLSHLCQARPIHLADSVQTTALKQNIILRWQRVFRDDEAYKPPSTEVWANHPNRYYIGNPNKYYLRYKAALNQQWEWGLVAEKDPGEAFFNRPPKAIDSLIQKPYQYGFDFYSAFVSVKDKGWLQKAVIGDYHLLLGQGLNMWTVPAFGKGSNIVRAQRYAKGIKGNSSANESSFLRGVAAQIGSKHLSALLFYANTPQDATVYETDSLTYIESIAQGGYHRTPLEMNKKKALQVELYGVALAWKIRRFRLQAIHSFTRFSLPIIPPKSALLHRFSGDKTAVSGADYAYTLRQVYFFGECSYQYDSQTFAFLQGMSGSIKDRLKYTWLFRHYPSRYHNPWAAAFAERSENSNETGLYIGLSLPLSAKWKAEVYADMFRFPWLQQRVSAPSIGSESGVAQCRFQEKAYKLKDTEGVSAIDYYKKWAWRYRITYRLFDRLEFRNQIDYQRVRHKAVRSGVYISQDMRYTSANDKWGCIGRIALFNADDYAARLYVYEHDVLYAFSVPAFYQKGLRAYALVRYKYNRQLSFWCKIAATWYQKQPLSWQQTSNKVQDQLSISLQLQWKPTIYKSRKKIACR